MLHQYSMLKKYASVFLNYYTFLPSQKKGEKTTSMVSFHHGGYCYDSLQVCNSRLRKFYLLFPFLRGDELQTEDRDFLRRVPCSLYLLFLEGLLYFR